VPKGYRVPIAEQVEDPKKALKAPFWAQNPKFGPQKREMCFKFVALLTKIKFKIGLFFLSLK